MSPRDTAATGRWIRRAIPPVAAAMALLFQVSCLDLSAATLTRDRLSSGDSYTWQVLIESWQETGRWSPRVASHNAPGGLETHLTMPYAALVATLARPVSLLVRPEDATRVAGRLSGPVLHVAASVALACGAMAVLGPGGAIASVAAFLGMLGFISPWFGAQKFDHHALHVTLALVSLALLLRYAVGHCNALAAAAGLVAGVGIWAGTEMLIPASVGGLALGFCWAAFGGIWRARGCFAYATGMAVALSVALLVDRPAEWDALDRLSGAHGLMGGVLVVATGAVAWVQRRRTNIPTASRFAIGMLVAGSAAAALWAAGGDFYLGPYGVLDPVVQDHFKGLGGEQGIGVHFRAWPGFLGYHIALGVLVAVCAATGLSGSQRDAWALPAVGLVAGGVAAMLSYRLVWHYEVFACVALGGLAAGVGRSLWHRASFLVRAAALPTALVLMLSPYVAFLIATRLAPAGVDSGSGLWRDDGCDWMALGKALRWLPERYDGPIVTYAGPGPELAHFSGRGVVATGCHCNPDGMRDALAVLLSPTDVARQASMRRGVAYVVQCPATSGWQGHDWYLERSGPDGVYARLARGHPPDWLVPVPTVALGVDGFIVYRTTFAKSGQEASHGSARASSPVIGVVLSPSADGDVGAPTGLVFVRSDEPLSTGEVGIARQRD